MYRRPLWKYLAISFSSFEPRHVKTNIMGLRPAWIQTSLRIRGSLIKTHAVRYQFIYLLYR
jgi:hypothetical protein